ncbi:oligosaccharide flippase family protein [Alkalimarinus coralli]|uniref:oligosaccharide flippase family protein n=1 Tax=Alkalimarinus coralli TaxID=2935863 RepID=UPI00202AE6FE|nr:oligosaccharide flippase family protein [Alkalimarinus coralli]
MSTGKALLKGSITRVSQTLISIGVGFFMMPFLVTNLGDDWYGVWAIVGSLVATYHLLDFGFATAVTRNVSHALAKNDSHMANVVINTSLAIYAFIAFIALCITFTIYNFADVFTDDPARKEVFSLLILLAGVSISLELPFNSFAGIAGAKLKFHQVAYVRTFTNVLGAILNITVIKMGYGIIAIAVVSFIVARISNILYYVICKRAFPDIKFSTIFVEKAKAKELFDYSIWSFCISVAYNLRNKVDVFVIGAYLSAAVVTHYYIAVRLVEYLVTFLYQATNMFVPVFTKYIANNEKDKLEENLLLAIKINTVFGITAAFALIFISQEFITLWMGEEYTDAIIALQILLAAKIIGFINNPMNSVLYATSKHKWVAILDSTEVAINLILSILLVTEFGMNGVALATLIPIILFRTYGLPAVMCNSIGISKSGFFIALYKGVTIATIINILVLMPIYFIKSAIPEWAALIIIIPFSGISFVACMSLVFNSKEKEKFVSAAPEKLKRPIQTILR